jgi:hypothetical protein
VGGWPFAAIAQSPAKVYRIGLLSTGAALADTSPQGAPLIRGLAQYGYALGRNLAFERRGSSAQTDRLPIRISAVGSCSLSPAPGDRVSARSHDP